MLANQLFDSTPVEQLALGNCRFRNRVQKQRLEHTAKPVVDRDVEANLRFLESGLREFVLHQPAQQVFRCGAAQPKVIRKAVSEINDAGIQEWRSRFQRVRHADAVYFVQDVVGQIVALVEIQALR